MCGVVYLSVCDMWVLLIVWILWIVCFVWYVFGVLDFYGVCGVVCGDVVFVCDGFVGVIDVGVECVDGVCVLVVMKCVVYVCY